MPRPCIVSHNVCVFYVVFLTEVYVVLLLEGCSSLSSKSCLFVNVMSLIFYLMCSNSMFHAFYCRIMSVSVVSAVYGSLCDLAFFYSSFSQFTFL